MVATQHVSRADRRFYSVPECATVLGLSRATIYQAVKSGCLAFVPFGSKHLVTAESLDSFETALRNGEHVDGLASL